MFKKGDKTNFYKPECLEASRTFPHTEPLEALTSALQLRTVAGTRKVPVLPSPHLPLYDSLFRPSFPSALTIISSLQFICVYLRSES